MTPLKALIAAASVVVALVTVSESASARGNHHHGGYRHGPSVNFSFGYWGGPRYWGPGYWGSSYWGPGYWGSSYWGPGWGYWGPPAVAYSPTVIVQQEPRVWVESDQVQSPTPAAPAPSSDSNTQQWWYWCASGRSYYPYVASCTEGWQRVAPQLSPGAR